MTSQERAILAFVEKNHPIAKGVIRDCFPQWDTANILERLESEGLVYCKIRSTIQGEQPFYSTIVFPTLPHGVQPIGEIVAAVKDVIDKRHADSTGGED